MGWGARHSIGTALAICLVSLCFTAIPSLARDLVLTAPKKIPNWQLQDPEGHIVDLASFKGRVVVLDVWATWCGPCREEFPSLDRLQTQLKGKGVSVVPVSVDQTGWPAIHKFYYSLHIGHLNRYWDQSMGIMEGFDMPGLPTAIVLDRQGREVGRVIGAIEWDNPEVVAVLDGLSQRK